MSALPGRPVGDAPPYADAGELQADLDILDRSLIANNSAILARGRLRLLRRAVDCFGFHLASLDLRQNSDVHERTVAELLDAACPARPICRWRGGAHRAAAGSSQRTAAGLALRPIREETVGRAGDLASRGRGARQVRQR